MPIITGNTVGIPNPQTDWSQTDENKADFLKNKPFEKVDDKLNNESTNPVQNKAVSGVIQQIIDAKAPNGHTHGVADLTDFDHVISEIDEQVSFSKLDIISSKTATPFITYDNDTGVITLDSNNTTGNFSVSHYSSCFSFEVDSTPVSIIFAEDESFYYISNITINTANYQYIGGLVKVDRSTGAETHVVPKKNTHLERNIEKGEKILVTYTPNLTVTVNGSTKSVNRYIVYRKKVTDVCFRQFMVYDMTTDVTPIMGFYSYSKITNIKMNGFYKDIDFPKYPIYNGYQLVNDGKSDYALEISHKKWLAIGDSITGFREASSGDKAVDATDADTMNSTYGVNYINFVEAMTGHQACRKDTGDNYGYSGYALGGSGDHGNATLYNTARSEWDDVETNLITLFAGTNDYVYGTEIGSIDDYINNTGINTIYGALRLYIDYFKTKGINDEVEIVLITPIQRFDANNTRLDANSKGYYLSDYVDAIKKVGAYESLKVIDLYNCGGIGLNNYDKLLKSSDLLHPNKQGYEVIAKKISEALTSATSYTASADSNDSIVIDSELSDTSENPVQNKVITKLLNNHLYTYATADTAGAEISLNTNSITYVYGEYAEDNNIDFAFNQSEEMANDIPEEIVLIVDLSLFTEKPSLTFPSIIKWFGGEPPEVEAGKVYMFSFVYAKGTSAPYYLGIGGEFA